MGKKNTPLAPTIAQKTAILVAFAAFVCGFGAGVGVTLYKSEPIACAVPDSSQNTDYAKMAMDLELRVGGNPQDIEAWVHLGNVYFDTDQFPKAIDAYEKALALKPDSPDVWTDLGIMYHRDGRPQKAIECFDQAMVIDPRHEHARFNKGIVLIHDMQDQTGAIQAWEELLEINPLAMASNGQSVDEMVKRYRQTAQGASK